MKGLIAFAIFAVACGGNARTVADAAQPTWSVTCDVAGGPPRADAHPTYELGTSHVNGDLDRALITDVLERATALAACPTPSSPATVEVQWFIDPHGAIAGVSTEADPLARCVGGVVARLRFPPPKGGGGVQVSYRFAFHPPRAQSFAALGKIESGTVRATIEAHLPAIADCFAHAPDRLSIDVGATGPQVDVGAEPSSGCVAKQLAAMQPTTMPIACAVTHG
jgi:hypothetical protein